VRAASEQKPKRSFAARALIGAWLSLLIVLAAASGYVLMSAPPAAEQASESELAMPVPDGDSGTDQAAQTPAPMEPAATPEQGTEAAPEQPAAPGSEATPEAAPDSTAEVAPAEAPPVESAGAEGQAAPPAEPAEAPQQAALPEAGANEPPAGVVLPPVDESAPWRRNSQAFADSDTRPRIAVVLTGLGLSSAATEAAIKQLPAGVTLSFTPYARRLNEWIALARASGHEVMLDLPMEPTSYPNDDPGPQALLTALSARQNLERLDWTLSRGSGFVGVAAVMGSRFAASTEDLGPVLEELKARGLMYLDNRASDDSAAGAMAAKIGLPVAVNDRALDWAQASRVAIDARLVQLENVAAAEGFAVAIGQPYPVTIERLREWSKDLDARGFALAPITAIANRQKQHQLAVGG